MTVRGEVAQVMHGQGEDAPGNRPFDQTVAGQGVEQLWEYGEDVKSHCSKPQRATMINRAL